MRAGLNQHQVPSSAFSWKVTKLPKMTPCGAEGNEVSPNAWAKDALRELLGLRQGGGVLNVSHLFMLPIRATVMT